MMTLDHEKRINLAEAHRLAGQAVDLLEQIVRHSRKAQESAQEVVLLREMLGGALWRLTDAAGLVATVQGRKRAPTGRGFVVADVYEEGAER